MADHDNGIVAVESDRLAHLENEVNHINKDVHEIKGELVDFRVIHKDISESLVKLTMLAEQNQKLEPKLDLMVEKSEIKIEKLSERISKNEKFIAWATGVIAVIAIVAPIIGPKVVTALGF